MNGIFKLYVETKEGLGSEFSDPIKKILKTLGTVHDPEIQAYWKIEDYLEVSFRISNISIPDELAAPSCLKRLADDWDVTGDNEEASYVWNMKEVPSPHDERIRWMNLEVFI